MSEDYFILTLGSTSLKNPRPVRCELVGISYEQVACPVSGKTTHELPVSAETLNLSRSSIQMDMFYDCWGKAIFSEKAFRAWSELLPDGFKEIDNVVVKGKVSTKKFYIMKPDIGPDVKSNYFEQHGGYRSDEHEKFGWLGYSIPPGNTVKSHVFLSSGPDSFLHCDQKFIDAAGRHQLKGLHFYHHSLKRHELIPSQGSHYFSEIPWDEAYRNDKKSRAELEEIVKEMEAIEPSNELYRPTRDIITFNAEKTLELLEASYRSNPKSSIKSTIISLKKNGYLSINEELLKLCENPAHKY